MFNKYRILVFQETLIIFCSLIFSSENIYALFGTVGSLPQDKPYAYILDVTDPENIEILYESNEMYVQGGLNIIGDYAYFGTANFVDSYEYTELLLVDITDIKNPFEVNRVTDYNGQFLQMSIKDEYGYSAGWHGGLYIFDLSDPQNPILKKRVEINDSNLYMGVTYSLITDNILYLSNFPKDPTVYPVDNSKLGLYILDISDPLNPEIINFISSGLDGIYSFTKNDKYLYCCYLDGEIVIYDISNPKKPEFVNSFTTSNFRPTYITFYNNFAYVADIDMFKGVLVFDANNPTDLKLVNQLSTPTRIVYEIQVFNDKLYVADYSGLITYDLSNPEKPERISIFRTDPYKGFRLKIFTK